MLTLRVFIGGTLIAGAVGYVESFTRYGMLAFDAHIYYRGVAAWLSGSDPWAASYWDLHFAAPPWVLPFLVPFASVCETGFVVATMAASFGAGAFILWRLRLSPVWILFGPLLHGMLAGNPIVIAVALSLAGIWPLALLLRPQLLPAAMALRRWRALLGAALVGVVLFALLTREGFLVSVQRYSTEVGAGTGTGSPIMLAIGAVSILVLALVDLKAAGWLATIVLVPTNGWYAGIAALPVLHPILAVGLALPIVGLPTVTVAVYALWRVAIRKRHVVGGESTATDAPRLWSGR